MSRHVPEPSGAPLRTTSWGAAWIESLVLARTFEGAELSRARGLVARGAVTEFEVEPASVAATVAGRSALERRVRIGVRRFDDDQWRAFRAVAGGSSRFLVALLDGRLPEALHEQLVVAGCSMLPGPRDVSIDCSCGNLAESCVHAAAACCRLADSLDDDPLMLITLRGGDRAALLATCAPGGAGQRDGGRSDALGSSGSVIAGRPADPSVGAAQAWRRRLEPLPSVEARGVAGRPRLGATPPPAELGFDQAGLDRLVRDAAQRAAAVLVAAPGAARDLAALDLDPVTDAVRRAAVGLLHADAVARLVDGPLESVAALTAAWRAAGAAGVEAVSRPRRLDPDEVACVEAAWEVAVKARSTGAVLPDGRQVRRTVAGTWVLVAADPVLGWRVVDSSERLDDIADAPQPGASTAVDASG